MKVLMPFKAVVYNQQKVGELSKVTCPPYDVISPERQIFFHRQSPYNFIHVLLGKDIEGEDKYKRAAECFRNWLKEEILIREEKPAFYFYLQHYTLRGEKRKRSGLIGLLKLQDEESRVFGHERTRSEPKEDRFRLIKKVKANLSPIFAIFSDKHRIIKRVYQQCLDDQNGPFIDIIDTENVRHQLWRIDSPEAVSQIQNRMEGEDIFIADGHHRYEVACIYRDLMKKKNTDLPQEYNYILAYFTSPQTPDLTILPIHRLVHFDKGFDFLAFQESLREFFEINTVKDKAKFFFLFEKASSTEHVLGMYQAHKYYLLRLKNIRILDRLIADKPKEYRRLGVSILNYIVLKKILGLDIEDKKNILFSHNADNFIKSADENPASAAFFLNPVKMEQIMEVALAGERMPSKSTFFYPKVLSGMLINRLDA